jgi:hypothetical protein
VKLETTRDRRLCTLVKRLREMVHSDDLYDLGEVDHEINALGITLDLGPCERIQRLAELMKLPHNPFGYNLVTLEKALQEKVFG